MMGVAPGLAVGLTARGAFLIVREDGPGCDARWLCAAVQWCRPRALIARVVDEPPAVLPPPRVDADGVVRGADAWSLFLS